MTDEDIKRRLNAQFQAMRLYVAGREDHPSRWSATDLATDLVDVVREIYNVGVADEQASTAKLRAAIQKSGFSVMETSGEWSLHCVTEAAQEAEAIEGKIIRQNVDLQIRVDQLRQVGTDMASLLIGYMAVEDSPVTAAVVDRWSMVAGSPEDQKT